MRFALRAMVFTWFALPALYAQTPEGVTREKMLETPQWQEKYDQYAPSGEILDVIKPKLAGAKVDVVLGLWCPDSRNNLPPFLKIVDALGDSVSVRYFSVPRKPSRDVKYYFEEWKVERVPTFIFYRDGKEIGRIVEKPKAGMLEDILDLVMSGMP